MFDSNNLIYGIGAGLTVITITTIVVIVIWLFLLRGTAFFDRWENEAVIIDL